MPSQARPGDGGHHKEDMKHEVRVDVMIRPYDGGVLLSALTRRKTARHLVATAVKYISLALSAPFGTPE